MSLVCISKHVSNKLRKNSLIFSVKRCFSEGGLKNPKTISITLSAGNHELKAQRRYMEDRFVQSSDSTLCAVFDGHVGAEVAQIMSEKFETVLQSALASHTKPYSNDQLVSSINSSVVELDAFVLSQKQLDQTGTTVSLSYVNLNPAQPSIITANAGDSRVVLSHKKVAIALTTDHKPNDPAERERIESLGGVIEKDGNLFRVSGILAMSRALGDHYLVLV